MYETNHRPRIKNVFLYIRQSTDEKAQRQVRSLKDQQRECEILAERLGLNIVQVFREDKSAKKPHQRPVFKSMLKELSYKSASKRRADGILSWHPNRLSRNALEAGMIIQMLDDTLINDMYFPAYSFHNDASGKEHLFIEFARAKGYSDHLSVSVMRGTCNREREGAMVYPVKFGYQKRREVPETPALCSLFPIPCPTNYPIVRRIFELRREGRSLENIEISLISEALTPTVGKVGKSRISSILADQFYFGLWYINKGKPNERQVDLRTVTLPDGTRFEPVLNEVEFWDCQSERTKNQRKHKKIKHINPFPNAIVCNRCGKKMRPCWKKIKRTGGKIEPQLGYECQTRIEGVRCKQPRLKAEVLYDYIADVLETVSTSKKDYQRFLIGSHTFIRQKTLALDQQRRVQSQAISKLKTQQLELVKQKAALAANNALNVSDKCLLDKQLAEITEKLELAHGRKRELSQNSKSKIIGFRKFIELSRNLHTDWHNADLSQKRKISEKILLNLTIETREIRSQTWSTPFEEWLKTPFFKGGRGELKNLEPYFMRLWTIMEQYPDFLEDWE